ncbi:MAG TPA: aldolase/citrate lyase family protein [Rhizomicrobium sp.]|nr:aldolase/citrate lyase family protein [Alphaproteobacteria bacterium]HUO99148.1 aldolase/citrate lyase family protein [Rhizomicrobium sp.]
MRNAVRDKLARDEVVLSMSIRLVRTMEIAALAQSAGFDSIYIDVEHSSFSLDTTSQICMAGLASGITPFVRVPSIDVIPRVLDGGALGVIAPHVQSAQDAARVVRAAKYPPLGDRSFTGALPQLGFRPFSAAEALPALNDATTVVAMIESAEALGAVDEIAAVDGVDLLFIGTNDLCLSLGIPGQFDHALVRDSYTRTMGACRRHGKHLGIGGLAGQPKLVAEFIKLGARYVSTGTDLSFLLGAATARVKQMRAL